MNIRIRQIATDTLSCEPLIERTENGELVCVCQCGDIREPAPGNRVYVFHSKDNGDTWFGKELIYPEDGNAVYATELTCHGNELVAYLTIHSGHFLDWKCVMMKSTDNGYTWENIGEPPFFPEYTFIRGELVTKNGNILLPYQTYPVSSESVEDVKRTYPKEEAGVWMTNTKVCESGVLISTDNGKNYSKHTSCFVNMEHWIWSEPTVAECPDGKIVMLLRECGSGFLYRCDSTDGGKTWSKYTKTDIPNPSNKPRLIMLDGGKIALIHTPNSVKKGEWGARFPLELWISEDGMETWAQKIRLTDFPGSYSYTDGFYENGHILFVIEHNRHTILFFDVTL